MVFILTQSIDLIKIEMTLINEQDVSQDVDGTRADYYRGICPKYVNWMDQPPYTCKGKWIRGVCNFGVGDLHRVQASPCLFANKFNFDVDKNAAVYHFMSKANLQAVIEIVIEAFLHCKYFRSKIH